MKWRQLIIYHQNTSPYFYDCDSFSDAKLMMKVVSNFWRCGYDVTIVFSLV